jgi:hypothetical protein
MFPMGNIRQPLIAGDLHQLVCGRSSQKGSVALPKEEEAMADQKDPNTEKSEIRVMWVGSVAILLLLLGAMGINMLITHTTSTSSAETSSQLGTPPK